MLRQSSAIWGCSLHMVNMGDMGLVVRRAERASVSQRDEPITRELGWPRCPQHACPQSQAAPLLRSIPQGAFEKDPLVLKASPRKSPLP